VHDAHREPARVPQQHGVTALVRGDRSAGAAGQPVQVTSLRGLERESDFGLDDPASRLAGRKAARRWPERSGGP
jgi:hypothetical protein